MEKDKSLKIKRNAMDNLRENANIYTMILVLAGMIVILSLLSPKFLSVKNLISVLQSSTTVCLLGAGVTFIMLTGGIDLSLGATMAICTIVMGNTAVNPEMGVGLAAVLGILAGLACGALNGALVTLIGMPPFIATLGTMTVIRGLCQTAVKGGTLYNLPEELRVLGANYIGPIPTAVIFTIIVLLVGWFLLKRTTFGRALYAVGSNEHASRLSGIRVNMTKFMAYVICGLFCSLSAWITLGRINQTFPDIGTGYELDAITAAAIGGISLQGGKGNIWGVFVGAVLVQVLINGMTLLNISEFVQTVVTGLVILIAVGIDSIREMKAERQ